MTKMMAQLLKRAAILLVQTGRLRIFLSRITPCLHGNNGLSWFPRHHLIHNWRIVSYGRGQSTVTAVHSAATHSRVQSCQELRLDRRKASQTVEWILCNRDPVHFQETWPNFRKSQEIQQNRKCSLG